MSMTKREYAARSEHREQLRRFIRAMTPDEQQMLRDTLDYLKEIVFNRLHRARVAEHPAHLTEFDCTNQRFRVAGANPRDDG